MASDGSDYKALPTASDSKSDSSSNREHNGPALSLHGSNSSPVPHSKGDSNSLHESEQSSTYSSSEDSWQAENRPKSGWRNPVWRKRFDFGNFDNTEPHIGFVNIERFLLLLGVRHFGEKDQIKYDWLYHAFVRAAHFWDDRVYYDGEDVLMKFLQAIPSNGENITTLERVEKAFVETAADCGDRFPVWEGADYYEYRSHQSHEQ